MKHRNDVDTSSPLFLLFNYLFPLLNSTIIKYVTLKKKGPTKPWPALDTLPSTGAF